MSSSSSPSVEELESRYKALVQRCSGLEREKNEVEAEIAARRRSLKLAMEQAREEGFDPDALPEDIRRDKEIFASKLDIFETDLDATEKLLRPMIAETQKG